MKETRKAMMAKRGRAIAPPEMMEMRPPPAERAMAQTRHIRCPCCGLQARAEPDPYADIRKNKPLPSIREGPYMPEASMVTWGGSRPKDMPGQRVRASISWDPEPCTPEEMQMLLQNLHGAIEMIEGISQEIEGGESEPKRRRPARATKKKA